MLCGFHRSLDFPQASGSTAAPGSLEASPRLDFGVNPNSASRLRPAMIPPLRTALLSLPIQSAWFRGAMQGM
jgi:hypothetical protein